MVSKKTIKIVDIIGLGAVFALFVIGSMIVVAIISSLTGDLTAYVGGLVWIFIILIAMIPLRKYLRFYKIDKTIIYSILAAIAFLIIAFLLWSYVFPPFVVWFLNLGI